MSTNEDAQNERLPGRSRVLSQTKGEGGGSQGTENLTPPKRGLPRVLHGYITVIIT